MPAVQPMLPQQQDDSIGKAVSIFGLGQLQRSPYISTVKRINAVVELTENGRQQAAIFGMPGLGLFIDTGASPLRAFYVREGELTFYAVIANGIWKIPSNLPATLIAAITTLTGPVWIADNGTQLMINDGVTAYIYVPTTGVITQITDPDFPAGSRGGTFLQGRFWIYTTTGTQAGRVYGSDQYNGLSWDALNFFTPEATPDGIVSVFRWFNDLIVFGKTSLEWWTGVSTQIPGLLGFQPITGANTEVGLGGELSYARVGQKLFFLGRANGQAGVYEIVNYVAKKVSPPAIDVDIIARINHSVSVGSGYMVGGHSIFQLTFPADTIQNAITWALDAETSLWCKRESYGQPYYRGLYVATTLDRIFISDAFNGTIWEMSDAYQTEGNDPLIFELTSIHLLKEGDMLTINNVRIDMETGLGSSTGQGSNPQAMIQISKDGGNTWELERWVPLGKIGEYRRRAIRRRVGSARDIAIRFRVTDPIPRRVAGAYLRITGGLS